MTRSYTPAPTPTPHPRPKAQPLTLDTPAHPPHRHTAGFPSSFIAMRPLRWLLGPMLDATRPMDNMALTWQLPAEDEIATCTLTGGPG